MADNLDNLLDQFFQQTPGGYEGSGVSANEILNRTMGPTPDEEEQMRAAQLKQPANAPMQGPDLEGNGQTSTTEPQKGMDNPISQALENAAVGVRDWIDNTLQGDQKTPEQIRDNRDKMRGYQQAQEAEGRKEMPEAMRVGYGTVGKTIEGFGEFGELVGDTAKTALQGSGNIMFPELVGPLNPKDNVFSNKYEAAQWDLGSSMYAETGIGKVAEGFLSFGATLFLTGGLKGDSGVLGAVKAIKSGKGAIGAAKEFGVSGAMRGALADLIQNPEEGNLSNLIKEHAPEWYPTWLTALAVEEGENPWLSRIKTAFEGMGLSEVADMAIAVAFGRKAGVAAEKAGESLDDQVDAAAEATREAMAAAPERAPKWGDVATKEQNAKYFTVGERQVDNLDPVLPAVESLNKGEISGFTVNPVTGEVPTKGYAVAIDASEPLTDLSPQGIQDWLTDNASALSREDAVLGGWLSDLNGKPVIEVSRLVDDIDEAKRLGTEFDQVSVYSLETKEFIPTGGTDTLKTTKNIGFQDLNAGRTRNAAKSPASVSVDEVNRAIMEAPESLPTRPDDVYVGDVAADAVAQTASRPVEAFGISGRGDGVLTEAGYGKIAASPDGEQYIRKVVESNPDLQQIAEQTRKSVDEIRNEAADIVAEFTGDVERLPGFLDMDGNKILSDPAVVAAKTLIKSTADDLSDSAIALLKADEAGMNLLPNATRMVDQLKSLLRAHKFTSQHYGRGLSNFRVPGLNIDIPNPFKLETVDEVAQAVKKSDEMLDDLLARMKSGDPEQIRKASQMANALVLAQGDPTLMKSLSRWGLEVAGSDFLSLFYNSMLSGPATHLVNTISNLVNTVYRPASAMLGSFFVPNGQVTRRAAAASFSGIFEDLRESFDVAGRVLTTGGQAINDGGKGLVRASETAEKLKLLRKAADNSSDEAFKYGVNFVEMFHAFANNPVLDWPARLLTTSDEFFKTMVGRMEWRSRTFMEAATKAEGSMDELGVFYKELLKKNHERWFETSGQFKGAIKDSKILQAATDVTFQTELEGVARNFATLVNAAPPLRVFFPFVKTGHNVLAYAYSHLPVIGTWIPEYTKAMKSGDESLIAVMKGRQAFGSVLIGTAGFAAISGNLTGNGPADPGERKEWLANNKPRSIRLPGTDTWFDYSRIEPFNMILSAVADVAFAMKENKLQEKDADYLMGYAMYALSKNLTERSYFAGLVPLGQLLTPNSQGLKQLVMLPAEAANNFIPYASARRALSNAMNPYMMEFKSEMDRLMFNATGGLVNNGAPAYDWLNGQPINSPSGGGNAVWPYKIQQRKQDMVRDELEDIGYESAEISKRGGAELTPTMLSKVQRDMGTSTLHKELERLIKSKPYQQMKEDAIGQLRNGSAAPKRSFAYYKEISKIIDKHRDEAITRLYHTDNDFRYEFDKRQAERVRAGLKPQMAGTNYIDLEGIFSDPIK